MAKDDVLDLAPYRIDIERAAALTGQEVDRLEAEVRAIIMVPPAHAMSSLAGPGVDWPLWSSRQHSQHIMGINDRCCVLCRVPMFKLADGPPGPQYCSARWTGRRYDAPHPGELIRDWCLDRAWEIRGLPDHSREFWREHETTIIWGGIALALAGFWGAVLWIAL